MYRDWDGFGKGENAITVTHACRHHVVYEYGGTAEYFQAPRMDFAVRQTQQKCPDCQVVEHALEAVVPDGGIPIICSVEGVLKTINGHVVVESDHPWLIDRRDDGYAWNNKSEKRPFYIEYTYRSRIIPTAYIISSYLHRRDGVAYTEAQEAFMREYTVMYHVEHDYARDHRKRYSISRTWQFPGIWEIVEQRTGKKVYLTRPCDSHENILFDGYQREQEPIDRTPCMKGDAGDPLFG